MLGTVLDWIQERGWEKNHGWEYLQQISPKDPKAKHMVSTSPYMKDIDKLRMSTQDE